MHCINMFDSPLSRDERISRNRMLLHSIKYTDSFENKSGNPPTF